MDDVKQRRMRCAPIKLQVISLGLCVILMMVSGIGITVDAKEKYHSHAIEGKQESLFKHISDHTLQGQFDMWGLPKSESWSNMGISLIIIHLVIFIGIILWTVWDNVIGFERHCRRQRVLKYQKSYYRQQRKLRHERISALNLDEW